MNIMISLATAIVPDLDFVYKSNYKILRQFARKLQIAPKMIYARQWCASFALAIDSGMMASTIALGRRVALYDAIVVDKEKDQCLKRSGR
jgi:hypothetical protein